MNEEKKRRKPVGPGSVNPSCFLPSTQRGGGTFLMLGTRASKEYMKDNTPLRCQYFTQAPYPEEIMTERGGELNEAGQVHC